MKSCSVEVLGFLLLPEKRCENFTKYYGGEMEKKKRTPPPHTHTHILTQKSCISVEKENVNRIISMM